MNAALFAIPLLVVATAAGAQQSASSFKPTPDACAGLCQRGERGQLEPTERVQLQQCMLEGFCTQGDRDRGYTAIQPMQKAKNR